jgi:hypothetical protein
MLKMMEASFIGDVETIDRLLDNGYDVNTQDIVSQYD